MTHLRKGSFVRRIKEISIGTTLTLALISPAMQSCGNGESSSDEEEYEEVYTKGVRTYIKETEKGVFQITDEFPTPADSSKAIVSYLNGKVDTLGLNQAKQIIDKEGISNSDGSGFTNTLGNALLFGSMGYLLGRTIEPKMNLGYQAVPNYPSSTSKADSSKNRNRTRSRIGGFVPLYASKKAYDNSVVHSQNIRQSTTFKPVGSRSGFFRSGVGVRSGG